VRLETALALCRESPGATEDAPFGPGVLVFRVGGKIFAMTNLDVPAPRLTLKCDPAWATILRAAYTGVEPGYHTNKRHWNTVRLDGDVPDDELAEMVAHSYALVVRGLPRRERDALSREAGAERPSRRRRAGRG
jgi:predicted DNA-binding protein (MmcQ/YjbR family)